MWKWSFIAVALIACRGSNESRVCKQLTKLCGDDIVPATCAGDLGDAKEALGESWGKVTSCASDATSCPEVLGCFAGGFGNALNRWGDQFAKGAKRAMDNKGTHKRGPAEHDASAKCQTFAYSSEGEDLSAKWTECDDKVIREITCKPFIDDLRCECRTDGVEHGWFHAKAPPLDDRAGATRVAKANCTRDGAFDDL